MKLLTEGLRVELARDSGIRVAVVYPGAVSTGITENSPDVPEQFKEKTRQLSAERQVGVSAARAASRIVRGIERGHKRIRRQCPRRSRRGARGARCDGGQAQR